VQVYDGISIAAAGVAPLSNNVWDNGFLMAVTTGVITKQNIPAPA